MKKDALITEAQLKSLGFEHYYDSEVEDTGEEFSYSVFKIDIKDYFLEATIEYGADKQPRLVDFNLCHVDFRGRQLTLADIKLLKEII